MGHIEVQVMGMAEAGNMATERSEPLQKDSWPSLFSVSPSKGLNHPYILTIFPNVFLSSPIFSYPPLVRVTHRIVREVADKPLDEFPCVIE